MSKALLKYSEGTRFTPEESEYVLMLVVLYWDTVSGCNQTVTT
jgi:hypothetical protein